MIRLPGDPALESRLIQETQKALRARGKVRSAPSSLSFSEQVRYQVLRRQFAGPGVPFLPSLVEAARALRNTWRRWRPRT